MTSYFGETSESAILEKTAKIRTTIVAIAITTRIVIATVEKQQRIAESADTVPSCNDCAATIVARPLATTVKGGKAAFRKEDKVVIYPDSKIRRGLGIGTETILYKFLASRLFLEVILFNI